MPSMCALSNNNFFYKDLARGIHFRCTNKTLLKIVYKNFSIILYYIEGFALPAFFFFLLTIKHPVYSKFIGKHSKCGTPELLLQWHCYFSSCSHFGKHFFYLPVIITVNR